MLPEKFLERMQNMLGEEYPEFLQSYDREECHTLRLNTLKTNEKIFKQQVNFQLSPVAWNQDGFYYDKDDRPGRHPYHDAGVYYIQEASAMAPVVYLEAQPGEKVLDLCAAPGGKTTQIGMAMKQKGILICNEIHPARAKILSENVERMGLKNAIVTNETPQKLRDAFPEYFDRILVDAPCSGEGMFRKNEEACEEWSLENVQMCADRQDEILECAARMLVPGGRMVYSTCTFAPAENEGSMQRFLKSHPEFELEEVVLFPGMEFARAEWAEYEKTVIQGIAGATEGVDKRGECTDAYDLKRAIRLWPHKLRGEGHFLAVLRKNGEHTDGKKEKFQKGLSQKECKEYLEFKQENLMDFEENGIYIKFGDQLYLAPEHTPRLEGLKVLRPGLHLGTIKKNRFEPSHALALTLQNRQVKRVWNVAADSQTIADYLRGQTINAEGEKGWYLITVDNYGIGWGKLTGNVMKNHYPKGLRKN